MIRHSSSCSPAGAPPMPGQRRNSTQAEGIPADFGVFVLSVYLPHAGRHKRSWAVDERIARRHLFPTFGNRRLADITRSDVEAWLRGLVEKGAAPATCNRILAVLRSICALALEYGGLPSGRSPCAGVAPFKIHALRERHLKPDEARRLMEELGRSPRPEARALQLLLLTGARKSEILKARWEHIHLEQRLLTVPLSKSGRPRHITLSDEAAAVVRSIPRVPGLPWLFPGRAPGKPLSDIYLFWDKLRHKLGLRDARIHDLRHTFAGLLVNAGHSLYEVQRLLGHSDPRTTMRYAHLGQDALRRAAETVSRRLGRQRGNKTTPGKAACSACRLASGQDNHLNPPYRPAGKPGKASLPRLLRQPFRRALPARPQKRKRPSFPGRYRQRINRRTVDELSSSNSRILTF